MTLLGVLIIVLALLTAFAMGVITGEEVARDRHDFICDILKEEGEDESDDGTSELASGSDR